jgi:histidinol-phosphate phosphatase family protein
MSPLQSDSARPAAFLDRDGTIIVEREYLGDPDGVELMPGAAEAIRLLNDWGYWVIGVSNQSGVARGFYSTAEVDRVNQRIIEVLGAAGARLDRIYYCPHLPEINRARGEEPCTCRKPSPGMIEQAQADFPIDMSRSFVVGDQLCDIGLARAAGIPGILVLTGFGQGERLRVSDDNPPDFIADDLLAAVTCQGRALGLPIWNDSRN